MGNTSKKLAAKCTLLTKDEQCHIASTFKAVSKNSDRIREEDHIVSGTVEAEFIEKFWGPYIDPRLAQYLSNFLFESGATKTTTSDFNRFAELYVYNVRGTVDQKVKLLYNSVGMDYNETQDISLEVIKEYCESIASTYIKIVKNRTTDKSHLWQTKGFNSKAVHVQALGDALLANLTADGDANMQHFDATMLQKWLAMDMLLKHMTEAVFVNLYFSVKKDENIGPAPRVPSLLPEPEGISLMPDYPAFTDLSHVVWLNSQLPGEFRHKWRFLFSSHIHGESFSTMAGRIQDQGPSLLIIQDTAGYIFGGFATASWTFGPNFTGTEEAFLFTLAPKMRAYFSSGFNDHYQYFNNHTKTLPNGLLMGGQFNFGGIWLDADPFGTGSSAESCSTFRGYRRLSKEPTFKIAAIEVWGVGNKPVLEKDTDERDTSILDANPEAKAMLDMAGKTRHSEGIREPPPL